MRFKGSKPTSVGLTGAAVVTAAHAPGTPAASIMSPDKRKTRSATPAGFILSG
jgi:hypothetical protein